MANPNGKFLVQWVHGISDRQLFFAVWVLIVVGFILLMVSHLKRMTRRNFRLPEQGKGRHIPVDARRLPPPSREAQTPALRGNPPPVKKK